MFDAGSGTRRGKAVAALVVVSLAVLGVLTLLGYGIAVELLMASVGLLLGSLLARLVAPRVKDRFARRFGRRRDVAASMLVAALALGIVLVGAALTSVYPPLIPGEGRPYQAFVFGLAFGFGALLWERLAPAPRGTPEEVREARRTGARFLIVVGGAVAGVFGLTFAVYVAVEYVVGPVVRTFAP